VLVNNAGYALVGPVEDISLAEARREMETNFFGVLKMCQAVLPHFHARGGGRIINISSVAAVIGFPMNGLYGASKMAVYGLTETLAKELSPYGVKVTSIEPGGFRTNFALGSMAFPEKVSPHNRIAVEATKARMADFARIAQNDPAKGALAILALAAMDKPPVHLSLGEDALAMITGALKGRIEEYERCREIGAKTAFGG
jgi:NAD(P)-dependent dehydrogenase (short-subunit alcohol dehydrogenase family)